MHIFLFGVKILVRKLKTKRRNRERIPVLDLVIMSVLVLFKIKHLLKKSIMFWKDIFT